MIFNPFRFDSNNTKKTYNYIVDSNNSGTHECSYLTPEQFCRDPNASCGNFNLLNVNIRSLAKNFDDLKACMKVFNTEFNVIGLCETHLKDKPNDYLNLQGYSIKYTNRIGRERGGVCIFISDKMKCKLRKYLSHNLCHVNGNYESCFIEIERKNTNNVVVGVVYFIVDIDPVFKVLNSGKKKAILCYGQLESWQS